MLELLIKVVALGIASAMSPVILGITLTLLARQGAGSQAFALLAGGAVAALLLIAAGYLVATGSLHGTPGETASADLAIGVLMLAFGLKSVLAKDSDGKRNVKSGGASPLKWLFIGFVLNIANTDAVLLNFTAAKTIFQDAASPAYQLALVLVADLFYLLPCLLPILVYMLRPKAAKKALEPVAGWMERHGGLVTGAIFLIFGLYLLSRGLGFPL